MAWNADADEGRFRQDVDLGQQWVVFVAQQLEDQGLPVFVPQVQVRPSYRQRRAYRDQGDLRVNTTWVEVRSVAAAFTRPGNWPWREVHVEPASVMQSKLDHSALWLYVSVRTKVIVGLLPKIRELRLQAGVWNNRRGVHRDWMVAEPWQLLPFRQAVEYLHQAGLPRLGREPGEEG